MNKSAYKLKEFNFHIAIFILSYISLEYMHFSILLDKSELNTVSYFENICATFIDTCIIYAIPFFLIRRRIYMLFVPFILIECWCLVNIWYSRYFFTYLPPSLFTEFNNLDGLSANIIAAAHPSDLILVFTLAIAISCYLLWNKTIRDISIRTRRNILLVTIGIVLLIITSMIAISSRTWDKLSDKYIAQYKHSPTESTFKFGILYSTGIQFYITGQKTYSESELNELQPYFKGVANITQTDSTKNLIIVIVESLLSYPTGLTLDGIEITPTLNQLVKEGAYYNNNMSSEEQLGKSSDGQFAYLTGLLPVKQGVTVCDYFNNTFKAIPDILKTQKNYSTNMVIPTNSQMWRQSGICIKYGIDSLFSRMNYLNPAYKEKWLNDQILFECASQTANNSTQPFCSIILTSSTHSPYENAYEDLDITFPNNFSDELKIYIKNVHYMDKYLGKYIQGLKDKGIYENSIIVIVSDHSIPIDWFNMKNETWLPLEMPLYIINSTKKIEKPMRYPISQIDLYPTVLDLMDIESDWRGVGSSLLTPDSITNGIHEKERREKMRQVSDILLNSDYWRLTK